jgi:hypothetical protein
LRDLCPVALGYFFGTDEVIQSYLGPRASEQLSTAACGDPVGMKVGGM